jgi:hypothetical protein
MIRDHLRLIESQLGVPQLKLKYNLPQKKYVPQNN